MFQNSTLFLSMSNRDKILRDENKEEFGVITGGHRIRDDSSIVR